MAFASTATAKWENAVASRLTRWTTIPTNFGCPPCRAAAITGIDIGIDQKRAVTMRLGRRVGGHPSTAQDGETHGSGWQEIRKAQERNVVPGAHHLAPCSERLLRELCSLLRK